jgi:hypothetical protein
MPVTSHQIANTAALLGFSLRDHAQFSDWYDPDHGGGMVGLMNYLAGVAEALETVTEGEMTLGEGIDWYLTVDAVVEAILRDEALSTATLGTYLVRWTD